MEVAVAHALGLPPGVEGDNHDRLVAALLECEHVVVLDNLEHLLPEATPVIGRWLEACPGTIAAATAAADPLDEPPGVRPGSCGFLVLPGWK